MFTVLLLLYSVTR